MQHQVESLTQELSQRHEWVTNSVSDLQVRIVALDDIEEKLDQMDDRLDSVLNYVRMMARVAPGLIQNLD